MSVPMSKRGLSGLEVYKNAIRIRKEFTDLLLRDFGIKNKVRDTHTYTKKMSENDIKEFDRIVKEYNIEIIDRFPDWWFDVERREVMGIFARLIRNITDANTIYPTNIMEHQRRRLLKDMAIANCEELFQELQYIISVLPVDAQKYMRFVDMIETEEALLKGWRKKDNKDDKKFK